MSSFFDVVFVFDFVDVFVFVEYFDLFVQLLFVINEDLYVENVVSKFVIDDEEVVQVDSVQADLVEVRHEVVLVVRCEDVVIL